MKIAIAPGHKAGEPKRDIEHPANKMTADLLYSMLITNGFKAEMFEGELPQKVRGINEYGADIAVECHYNWMEFPHNPKLYGSGFECIVWPKSAYGKLLATEILAAMHDRLPFERHGVGLWERKDLYFLKHTQMPAVLVEPLWLDNPLESPFLQTKRGYEFVATSIFNGIVGYAKERNGQG